MKAWCCVLTSQALETVATLGSLGSAGVSSTRIDDYAVSFTAQGAGFTLPQHVVDLLRAKYGAGAYVTGAV